MKLFNYIIELRGARQPWTHFRIHRYPMHRHIIWGRLSLTVGQPHLEEIRVCSECGEAIECKSAGDESWDWCEGCQQLEGRTEYVTMEKYERTNQ